MHQIKPPHLEKGDTIGFVAPCYALAPKYADKARDTLLELGYRVKYAPNLFSTEWGFAATAQQRAADFNGMIADDTVKMLLFCGGEVSAHLLPLLDYAQIRQKPKLICSFSDSTTLLDAICSQSSLVTFYGASLRTFCDLTEYNRASFFARVAEGAAVYQPAEPWRVLCPGSAQGILIGGYLENFALLQHTAYFHLEKGCRYLLLLEDHEKFAEPAAVSRYFSVLEQAGLFGQTAGLIFGHYSDRPQPLIDEILLRIGEKYQIPVVQTADFGHGQNNAVFPLGAEAKWDAARTSFTFLESGVSGARLESSG